MLFQRTTGLQFTKTNSNVTERCETGHKIQLHVYFYRSAPVIDKYSLRLVQQILTTTQIYIITLCLGCVQRNTTENITADTNRYNVS